MASNPPPPEYTLSSAELSPDAAAHDASAASPGPEAPAEQLQVLITPAQSATDFQNGALGVEGEHATVEGEVQIKGAREGAWQRVSITFQTVETSPEQTVELGSVTQHLYVRGPASASSSTSTIPPVPSSLPFAIPLQPDTPECVHTPSSSLTHYLLVSLLPTDPSSPTFERKIPIHLRRYSTPSAPVLLTLPYEVNITDPVPVSVELPRLEFRVGEPLPVYITVPAPDRQRVSRTGLRLRNVKAELVRIVALTGKDGIATPNAEQENPRGEGSSTAYKPQFTDKKRAGKDGWPDFGQGSSSADGTAHTTIMSRSGAACRFHSSRPVRVRLVLHPLSLSAEVTASGRQPLGFAQDQRETEGCATITQTTLLHSVSFYLMIRIGFIASNGTDRGEVSIEQTLPITMLPGLAPVEEDVTASQYSKKHDKPPERTYRYDDAAPSGSGAEEVEGAAPPFNELDAAPVELSTPDASAPPPFFSDLPSTSHPPSFQEAQSSYPVGTSTSGAMGLNIAEWSTADPNQTILRIPGEGEQFGFAYEDIYDGFGDGSRTPPPPLSTAEAEEPPPPPPEIVLTDEDVSGAQFTQLLTQTVQRLQAMIDTANGAEAPPPPPAMDDPMDPPPAIDDAFRPVMPAQHQPRVTVPRAPVVEETATPATPPPPHEDAPLADIRPTQSAAAPPPYLVQPPVQPAGANPHRQSLLNTDQQDGHGPPPYSDFAGGPPAPI
ncbi:hypothetical protein CALVIDRAFT_539930 [Calocera viscosa TUFC12733]|uniref:Uncharacterized protein n=1 Tax=Calocera viscosa (strain TUFC12733) TaxID=1330018 RepID=A0A167JDB8_CALVF|nr:hypothetical protein CALVIDRAFT_539930 [Calocera viscosa TUFC12733]